jgi:hypothetical protein
MVALLVVALALGSTNFGAAIAIGVSGVGPADRIEGGRGLRPAGRRDVGCRAAGLLIGHGLAGGCPF